MPGKSVSMRPPASRIADFAARGRKSAAARRWVAGALVAFGCASPAFAHEFWLQPDQFRLAPGAETPLRLFVGERFHGEELAWDPSRTAELRHLSAGGEESLQGEEGAAPAAWVTLDEPGVHVVAYRSKPATLELAADRFNSYLLDDGHYRTLTARFEAGTWDTPGRERYTRYAKALLVCNGPGTAHGDMSPASMPVGHRLEIIPETDALALADGASEIAVRILFEGEPLGGAVVFAAPAARPEAGLLRTLTHSDGRCRFRLDGAGTWMISLVHMIECPNCGDADWDSSWATLVFARGDVVAASVPSKN